MTKRGRTTKMIAALLASVVLAGGTAPVVVRADQEYEVTASKAVLYSNSKTVVYAKPDINADIVTSIKAGIPVEVTGITSNGWFRVSIDGTFYIPGYGLEEKMVSSQASTTSTHIAYSDEDIKEMTRGTFSFFQNAELRAFTREDIQDMDDNTYIKYMDSFLIGKAMVDYCILQDSGVTLKTEYDKKAASDAATAAITMKDYLANYRNDFLNESMWGPVRNEEDFKVTLNRAIRYNMKNFNTVYKNVTIDDDEIKMDKLLGTLIKDIQQEQGVTFGYKKEYGTYKSPEGRSASGWIVEFTREK